MTETRLLTVIMLLLAFLAAPQAGAQSADWQARVKERVGAQDLPAALAIAEERLGEAPQDLEARAWRARLLAWVGRWKESEEEYRRVLDQVPSDADVLIGLAGVMTAQQRPEEALDLLDRARTLDPNRADLHMARGRALRALGRRAQAREAFRAALALEPNAPEARQGLDSVQEPPRHQFTAGADFDQLNYTSQDAQAYAFALRSDWNDRWTTLFGARFDHRSGMYASRWNGALTLRLTRRDAFTFGGSAGRDNGIVSKGEAFFDYGHGFSFARRGFLRGLEANHQQRWLWFDAARILTLSPNTVVYLPKDWTWSLGVTLARSSFTGTGAEWRPSGITRLTFPLGSRVSGNVFFAVGTENYALADQIGRFSAQTWGGGLRVQLPRRQEASGYFAYQNRTQGRTQSSVGFAYAVRF